jgi:hypothetical protein
MFTCMLIMIFFRLYGSDVDCVPLIVELLVVVVRRRGATGERVVV